MATVLLEKPQEGTALLRINRPEAKNALNTEVRQLLADYFRQLGSDPEVRCIIITGDQAAFAAGADLRELAGSGALEVMLRRVHLLWQAISHCPKPVIAAVNGYAWGGGCELAMHADIIVAGESASFCQPEIKVGIMPGAGGTQRLLRAVGKFKAMKMILTGQPVSAQEAFTMGLVSDVVPDAEVLETALKLARQIGAMPPLAVEQIKEVVLAGQDAPLETALMLERKAFQLLFDSQDQKEGMTAFFEKRKPQYRGR
ncbi:MAG: enoyl-CoA hydratase/isomerase family protein [Desulfuromonadales bacterium]|nr:enoyl-CoA hydratase/isomerase family protein [Desulfuromonadales bacterium]